MIKDIIYNNLSQGLQFGSRWILNVALIAILDIEAYAIFSFVYSLSNILLSILPFGSSVFIIAEVNVREKGSVVLIESLVLTTSLFLLILGLYIILTPILDYIKGWSFAGYGILLSYLLSLNLIVFSYFKGLGNFKKELQAYAIFCFNLLLFTAYGYFMLQNIDDIRLIFGVLIALNIVILSYTIIFSELRTLILTSGNIIKKSIRSFRKLFKIRLYFGLQEIVTAIYTQGGLLILFYILDEQNYGYYRALFVVVAPVFMITVAISQVILKYLKSSDNKIIVFRKIQRYTVLLGVIICTLIFFIKEYAFSFIEIEATPKVSTAFYIIIGITLVRFVFANYEMLLVVFNKQKQRFVIMLIAAMISIISIFVLLPQYGIVGAVITNAISYIVVLLGLLMITEKHIKDKQ